MRHVRVLAPDQMTDHSRLAPDFRSGQALVSSDVLLPVHLKCSRLYIPSPHTIAHCSFYYSATYILPSLIFLGDHLSLYIQLKSLFSFSRKTSFSILQLLSDFLHKFIYYPSPNSTFFRFYPSPSSSFFFLSFLRVSSSLLRFPHSCCSSAFLYFSSFRSVCF
jgi:hypothetical protein